ncbi:MAG: ATP synthase F1 subunit delta [Firmicutes bacterium]|nr:ATP synthase F1 subunit delta [Bacillota bacterium]
MKTAEVYADAFYSLAKESGKEKKLLLELKYILNILEQCPQYEKILDSPRIRRGVLTKILDEDFKELIDGYTLNLLKILSNERLICRTDECVKRYEQNYNADHNIRVVRVTTAKPLDAGIEKRLIQKLTKKFGGEIVIKKLVNPDCIGGIIIQSDGITTDASIKSKLNDIRRALA